MIKKNKKGETTIFKILIGIIVFVLVAAAVFYLFKLAPWTETIDKNACRHSVVLRGSTPELAKKKIAELPLQCETEKICIAGSFLANVPYIGGCDEFKGEDAKVEKVGSEEEIKKVIAEAMYECWQQFYLEDINLFDRSVKELDDKIFCALCSRIAFDKNIKSNSNYQEIYGMGDYLKNTKIPETDKTYMEYFLGSLGSIDIKKTEEVPILTKESYVVSYDIYEKSKIGYVLPTAAACSASLATGLYIGGAIATAAPVVGWIVGPAVGAGVFAAGCYAGTAGGEAIDDAIIGGDKGFAVSMNLRPYSAQQLEYCSSTVTIS